MQRALVTFTICTLLLAPVLAAHAQQAPDAAPARSTPFPDVPKSHWAFDAVEQLRQRGILRGYPAEAKSAAPKAPGPAASTKRRPVARSRRRR